MAAPIQVSEYYPMHLHYIKALFLEGQYRRCIQACRDIIKMAGQDGLDTHFLHATFIHFYLGLAHDSMARKMHFNSVARVPALSSAEQAFATALDALPSLEATRTWCLQESAPSSHEDIVAAEDSRRSLCHSPRATRRLPLGTVYSDSPVPSSPTYCPTKLPDSLVSPRTHAIAFDYDDGLESENSFSQIMTPNRALQRDFSQMSLLDGPPHAPQLPREASTMSLMDSPLPQNFHPTLLRQVQPGSSRARQTQSHGTIVTSNLNAAIQSQLPQLITRADTEPSMPPSRLSWSITPELVSPMSPSDFYARRWSNASTISAISPETPNRHDSAFEDAFEPSLPCDTFVESEAVAADERVLGLFDQITSLRDQLEGHLTSVQNWKRRTGARIIKPVPNTGNPLGKITPKPDRFSSPVKASDKMINPLSSERIQQARSYWSFVPENVKENQKKKLIASGRERMWKRERFDPTRYRDLCEKALAEL